MALVTVDVDVDLDEFDDDELMEEVKRRRLLDEPNNVVNLVDLARENRNAMVIQTGISEKYAIAIGGKQSVNGSGRATIIILDGE